MHTRDAIRFTFGDFHLDVEKRTLTLGETEVDLRPRCFDVLVHLVRNAGNLVTRRDTIAAVWPSVAVSDGSLSRCITDIRVAIGDAEKRTIRTIAGRGYQFAGPVVPLSSASLIDKAVQQSLDQLSIAVLPFENMSDDADQKYFSNGITEDIITELGRFRDLLVIARGASFTVDGQVADIRRIGEELGATYLVVGSVRKFEDRVRITAQLVEAASARRLWAERYDRKYEDIFLLQDEVVQAIVAAIPRSLDRSALERAKRKPPEILSAYDHCLKGISLLRDGGNKQTEALISFETAASVDQSYALAWKWTAYVYSYLPFSNGLQPDEAARKASNAIEKALELDDTDASIQATAAFVCLLSREYNRARSHAQLALELNPNSPDVNLYYGAVRGWLGEPEEGYLWIRKAFQISAARPDGFLEALSDNCYMQRNYSGAIESILRWRSPPLHMHALLAACYAQIDHNDKAMAAKSRFDSLRPDNYEIANHMEATIRLCRRQSDREHWMKGFRMAGFEF